MSSTFSECHESRERGLKSPSQNCPVLYGQIGGHDGLLLSHQVKRQVGVLTNKESCKQAETVGGAVKTELKDGRICQKNWRFRYVQNERVHGIPSIRQRNCRYGRE